MANLEGLRGYGEYGEETSDALLKLCLDAAKQWFKNAGVSEPSTENALYDMGVYRLAAFYHERRGLVETGAYTDAAPQGIQGIVHQIRPGGEVSS